MAQMEVSVVIPCLNEEETIGLCVSKALKGIEKSGKTGEVVVVDNGSTDQSVKIALASGARIVRQSIKGYGAAYLKGIEKSDGKYLVFGDGDDTYDFAEIPNLLSPLYEGADMVLGSRLKGKIMKGAMSFSHRYIGNPLLTGVLNLFFKSSVSDAHTGMRAISRDMLKKLHLKTPGMEFASEMIISALREKLLIREVPITYYARKGESKLNSLSDAWRHLRFMLLFSPTWLFLVPGLTLFLGGALSLLLSGFGKLILFDHSFDIHAMVFFILFCLLGFQIVLLGIYAKAFSLREGFESKSSLIDKLGLYLNLEKGILTGFVVFLAGFLGSFYIVVKWIRVNFVGPFDEIKFSLFCLLFMIIGIEIIFSSFFLSLLKMPRMRSVYDISNVDDVLEENISSIADCETAS